MTQGGLGPPSLYLPPARPTQKGENLCVRSGRYTVTFELTVAPDETGKVIGRNGRVAKAIRDLMSVAAARQNKRVHIDIE